MEKITGIILAGGKSSRMDYFPKGLLKVNNKHLIELSKEALEKVTDDVIIISNEDHYNFLGCPVYGDLIKDIGPLGGLISGLTYSTSEINLVTTCDMPFVTNDIFKFLIDNSIGYEAVIPSIHQEIQPLCALYKKNVVNILTELQQRNILKMKEVIKILNANKIEITKERFYSPEIFCNINTIEDLHLINKKHEN